MGIKYLFPMWFISWSVLCLSLPTIYGIGAIYWIGELDSIVYLHNLLLAFEIHLQSVCQQKSEPSTLVKTWGNRETAEHTGTQLSVPVSPGVSHSKQKEQPPHGRQWTGIYYEHCPTTSSPQRFSPILGSQNRGMICGLHLLTKNTANS